MLLAATALYSSYCNFFARMRIVYSLLDLRSICYKIVF